MLEFGVVKNLDIVEHFAPRFGASAVNLPAAPLPFEQREEAFGDGIVVAVSPPAHAAHEAMSFQERLPFTAREEVRLCPQTLKT
jgi:hypothetical protein